MAIVYRRVKGSALTSDQVDDNFQELSDAVGGIAGKLNIDGSNAMTGDLDLDSNDITKITSLKDATDVLSVGVQNRILYDASGNTLANFSSQTNGFGILAGTWAGYFKTTNLSTVRTIQLPDADCTLENTNNKDTDGTLAADSDNLYPSQKAVKTYVDAAISTGSILYMYNNLT